MAGRLKLSATGIQDYWLTEEPDFSYFLMNFKRHTKFSTEAVKTPFDGDCNFDTINECRIPNNKGDLMRSAMLQFTLPQPKTTNKTFAVTVSSGYFWIDGIKQDQLTLYEGTTYTFNNAGHSSHPFRFSETSDGVHNGGLEYTTGVTNPGSSVITFTVPINAPSTLYYYCSNHPSMGSNFNIIQPRYMRSIGSRIIDYADLIIGGQTIQRITGDYIYMYNQIHDTFDDNDQTNYFLSGQNYYIVPSSGEYTYNVLLPFYFFRHPSLSIPICALRKQIVEIHIKFKKIKDITLSYTLSNGEIQSPPSDISASIKDVSLITDFFYITEDEKNFLLTSEKEYVITQLQMSQIKMNPSISKKSIMINFKNPVKEMFFMAVSDDLSKYNPIKNVNLKFNNNVIFDADNLTLSYDHPLKYYTGTTKNNFGVYSFSLKPEIFYPTGQVNMSRIYHKLLEIELDNPDPSFGHTVYLYAVNYNTLCIKGGLAGLKF